MQISKISLLLPKTEYKKNVISTPETEITSISNNVWMQNSKGIAFGAMNGVATKKIVNIPNEKSKLLKQIDSLLKTQNEDLEFSDLFFNAVNSALDSFRNKLIKHAQIMQKIEEIAEDKFIPSMVKISKIRELEKQLKNIEKFKPEKEPQIKKDKNDEKIDYSLVNIFKNSVSENEYNLKRVFLDYYKDLEEIDNIDTLKEKYPKIVVPNSPQKIVAKKLVDNITRDFFTKIDRNYSRDPEKVFKIANQKVIEILDNLASQKGVPAAFLYENLLEEMHYCIVDKLKIAYQKGFSIFPEFNKKGKQNLVSDLDLKLLSTDFDKFVTTVVKQQYLESKKLSEIVYVDEENKIKISLKELGNSEYKFEKVPEKIKSIINISENIHRAQRNYEKQSLQELKQRLGYFSNTEIGNDERILEYVINFDSCIEADKKDLIKFLQELDSVADGEKSIEECLKTLKDNDIRPKATELVDEKEKQAFLELLKIEKQKTNELKRLRTEFDNYINKLYSKNLSNLAGVCSKYRPQSLEEKEIEKSDFIIKTIKESLEKSEELNLQKLESRIMRWDTFNVYQQKNSNSLIFQNAVEISKKETGEINPEKIGQYIINSEIIEMYPDSLEVVKYPELLTKIIERTDGDNNLAINYLNKIDTYQELSLSDKNSLIKILEIFDEKDSIDKIILRHFIENEYANNETSTIVNNGLETHSASIMPSAKKAIIEKYRYPNCIEYLRAFEEALSSFGTAKGSSGIKQTGRNNNAMEYKMELKLKRELDRLYSSKNDYCFDVYSEKGMH